MALISLILDTLARECSEVLEQEGVVVELRDLLRDAKGEFINGDATVDEALVARIERREAALGRRMAAGTAAHAYVRREKLVIALLRDFAARCIIQKTPAGEPAFRTIEAAYKEEVAKIKPAADHVNTRIDAAFDFIDECFASREMLVFMAELATRRATTQFVAHYGNQKYYQHNEELQVDAARMGLAERASMLADLNENIKQEEERASLSPAATGMRSLHEPSQTTAVPDDSALAEFYGGKQFEYGFTSVCKMLLPASDLKGKKVLNICCRRGRGVYKMSAMVGNEGSAMGVDWSPAYVAEAKDGMERAWHDSGLKRNNMEFRVAYPEDLIAAGIGSGTMDAVYCNNVVTLFYDQATAIREFGRVLKPGGLLILETIFADRPRNDEVVEQARAMGNSVQAARTQEENYAWLEAAGFATPSIEEEYEVEADRGYKAGSKVAKVEGDDDVKYKAVSLYIRKK